MGTNVYAFLEIKQSNQWVFAGQFVADDEYGGELVPQNIAPASWGKYNFAVYYEASGEKGFPPDLSTAVRQFVATHWPEANRPSWMTVADMRQFYESPDSSQYAHLDFETLAQPHDLPETDIRIVFWADQ